MKLPLITREETKFPLTGGGCPCCCKKMISESHSIAFIEAGALLINSETNIARYSPDLEAFFTIGWLGAREEETGIWRDVNIDIIDAVIGGEFRVSFCSTECLRSFFNACVDALERKVKQLAAIEKFDQQTKRACLQGLHYDLD